MNCNENCTEDNKCIPFEQYIKVVELARAYVPFQNLCSIYDKEESLIKGTIFPDLSRQYCEEDKNIFKEDEPCFEKMQLGGK